MIARQPVADRSLTDRLRRLAIRLGWLLAAVVLALGCAGVVAGADHLPDARPELTWGADRAIAPGLDASVADLGRLASDVNALGADGRDALAALTRQDRAALATALAKGSTLVARVSSDSGALRDRLGALPGAGPDMERRLGTATLARYDSIVATLAATQTLAGDWATLASGSLTAMDLVTLLQQHDTVAGEAARLGSKGDYAGALKKLDAADADLARARHLRDTLANTADVSTLGLWIDRNAAMDTALRALYVALTTSHGTATAQVKAALAKVKTAQASLPPDTRALVVIVSDLGRAGLNQAVIAIEEARGQLAGALDALGSAPAT